MRRIDLPNASVQLFDDFFSKDYFEQLKEEIEWQEKEIVLFGKRIMQPRLVTFYGDEGFSYKYSGQRMQGNKWTSSLLEIGRSIAIRTQSDFNSCLLNYYRDGADSMGWHQDNEKELGENPVILSASFGGTRIFKLKHITVPAYKMDIELKSNSLLIMEGETQHYYKHAVLKSKKYVEPRINLTFRKMISLA